MTYKEIFNLIKDTFAEVEGLTARKENGRIIISMKRETKVWTKDQEKWLNDNVVTKLEYLINESQETSKPPKWFVDWNNNVFIPRVDGIEQRLDWVENTPTIKKELSEINNK